MNHHKILGTRQEKDFINIFPPWKLLKVREKLREVRSDFISKYSEAEMIEVQCIYNLMQVEIY
ncbi:hypothetical protein C922_05386 [Plasmodium inui San Antonio 1]|uniref:Uncharacterized protein n=1 Tax=Plasmodium inui San Antonio 1 TaxID=1237626 RepID=W7AG10_9APIC|nr:hypothetical protein C922_05386 [Plasmodium inui San Antonio 1]EUD64231.1 hypothetical protein C922_05386 [Plasmodium inui San Antonio 1]